MKINKIGNLIAILLGLSFVVSLSRCGLLLGNVDTFSLQISPPSLDVSAGSTFSFTIWKVPIAGTPEDVSSLASWESSNEAFVVSNGGGEYHAISPGPTSEPISLGIGATFNGKQASASVTVNPSPEIQVFINSNEYQTGSTFTFGDVNDDGSSGAMEAWDVVIRNIGYAILNINSIELSGGNYDDFNLVSVPPTPCDLDAGSQLGTFQIRFNPLVGNTGLRQTQLIINSNDYDEGIFTINLQGNGV